ncbi:hypothetical protein [Kitasatospora viridis]|uniref:UDP-N-acetylglucosamine 1-carboxyvinyltransferase n=1 Tax=Kitasatospora viridis TaxID=281105 RepID=A0A561T6A2_9ACTN|nr:hypothetical protein [Kitasatospora viridis]TWF82641.1 UDP-N-acetylglucosamine 1-carboxyvinyltransferase [Kitasatospora viridis]
MTGLSQGIAAGPGVHEVTVEGGVPLSGEVRVPGFKHALVTVVAAAVLARAPVTIDNCPDIEEARVLAALLGVLGGRVERRDRSMTLDLADLADKPLDPALVGRIHGALYLIPGLLARFGQVHMPAAGGCPIGDEPGGGRPVGQYVGVLERFGATATAGPDGSLTLRADRLTACDLDLRDFTADRTLRSGPLYSGATKTAVLAAAAAHGTSRLRCPYPKADVTELVRVLQELGYDAAYDPHGDLLIEGRPDGGHGRPVRHALVSDLITVVTWATAAALTGGTVRLTGLTLDRLPAGLAPETAVGRAMGLRWAVDGPDALLLLPDPPRRSVDVAVVSHGIFSDSGPFLTLAATLAPGTSFIRETVWQRRFAFAPQLNRLGTEIRVTGSQARITGGRPPRIPGQDLVAGDLRAAAALLLASLAVPGPVRLRGVEHLARGYEDLTGELRRSGARIHSTD